MDHAWDGQARRLIVHPDANGMLYVVDRTTGQLLAADAVTESVVADVNVTNGETHYASDKGMKVNQQTRHVCPAWMGAFGAGAGMLGDSGLVALPVNRDLDPLLVVPTNVGVQRLNEFLEGR